MSPLYGSPIGPLSLWPGLMQYFFGGMNPNNQANAANSEFAEALTLNAKSIVISIPGIIGGRGNSQRQITWSTEFPVVASTGSIILQGAMRDGGPPLYAAGSDNEWVTVDTSTNVTTGEVRTIQTNFSLFRILISALTGGTNPTIICKARCM